MSGQKVLQELAEKKQKLSREASKLQVAGRQLEIDNIQLVLKELRASDDPHIFIQASAPIRYQFKDEWGRMYLGKRRLNWTKREISCLENRLASLLSEKYHAASPEDKENQIRQIPSELKGRLIPLFVTRYNALPPEDKKKQIDEVLNEVLSKLTLKVEQNNPISTVVSQLRTDIEKFKEVLKAEVGTPQKNGWLKSPNPMETALQLHNIVYILLDKEIDFGEKYPAIFHFHQEAIGSRRGPVIDALLHSILVGLTMCVVLSLIGAFITFLASPLLFTAGFLPILFGISGGISFFAGISSYVIQAYHNFPLTGGDMATRGKAVHDDLKALAHEIEKQHSTFGNFFQEIPVQLQKAFEETLGGGNKNETEATLNFS